MLASPALLPIFNALPGAYLLLSPDLLIEAVSDDYLAATLTQREHLLERYLFDAFPDNPQAPEANAMRNVRASLTQVLATGQPHEMAVQHYDVPDPAHPGQFVERHWQPLNTPVLDTQGQVIHIIHKVVNVTAQVHAATQLHESQTREQAALAEIDRERRQWQAIVNQAPVAIGFFEGSELRITAANHLLRAIWNRTQHDVVGHPLLDAVPELQGQGFAELLNRVRETQMPIAGTEVPAQLPRDGQLATTYYNFVCQPLYDNQATVIGALSVTIEVTEQVLARQRLEQQERQTSLLNEQLATANEELKATNEELLASNSALFRTQQDLSQLNEQLEARIAARTQDLTRAQAQTEWQRNRLEQLFLQAPAAICILGGPDLIYELVNPSYQQLFPGRQLLGQPIRTALPEIADNSVYQAFRSVYTTGITHEEKSLLIPFARPNDGQLENRYFNYIQQARYDEAGHIDGVLVFAFEVTTQVLAQQASEHAAQQMRLLTDALPVFIGYIDNERQYQFANQAYRSWFRKDPKSLLGRYVWEVVGQAAYQNIRGYMDQALTGEEVHFEVEMPYRPGFTKYIRTSFVPDVQAGQVVGFYTLVTDVTEEVVARQEVEALNRELATANQQLTRTNIDLDSFIYTASHDLKSPISNIEGLLVALRHELPAADSQVGDVPAILHLMQDSIARFTRTIAHLTEISRLQKEHNQPTQEVVLARVVTEVCLDLTTQIKEADATLDVQLPADVTILFSEKNLRSIVYNLLSNALKYRSSKRALQVRIAYQALEAHQVLEVQDNGLGLDLTQAGSNLFAMFKRLHSHVEGTGIGLYMVKRIIENAGGHIEVQSQLDVGSTFSVYFPR
jgi:PAS domain S-box-containing protein